ncbi:MAG: VRR-NUC domain-containing protein [Bacteroides sp.]|nr:VRR-NUC domain-containing protein [Bacteroides sp.]
MTFDELIALAKKCEGKQRKQPADEEHRIQCSCVRWFSLQYPTLQGRLFAVPNGGRRDQTTAAKLKAEGVVPGVADLILLKSNRFYGALLIEMKTSKGKQSESQKVWQKRLCANGEYKYVVCRSLDDFMREVNDYLKDEI